MPTANVTAIFNGTTPFDVNVAACNLLNDLSIKDFTVVNVSLNTVESATLWTKITPTLLRYAGGSPSLVAGNTLEIRRKTPNTVVQQVGYATRFSSDLWNQEIDRIIRWREEADLNGVSGAGSGLNILPNNDPYSLAWANDNINAPTRQTLFNYFASEDNSGYKNKLLNGRFQVWQRGVIGTTGGNTSGSFQDERLYLADKWTFIQNTTTGTSRTYTVSREAHTPGQTLVPNNPKYYIRVNCTNLGNTTSTFSTRLIQSLEGIHTLAGKTVTLSLYARSSVSSKALGYRIMRNTGSVTSDINVAGVWQSLTSSFARYSVTFTVPSLSGVSVGAEGNDVYYIMLYLNSSANEQPPNVNQGIGTTDISDVQLEIGAGATAIEPTPFTLDLVQCMRYYQQGSPYLIAPNTTTIGGRNIQFPSAGTAQWADTLNFPIPMARVPSVTVFATDGTPASISRGGVIVPVNVTNISNSSFFLFNNTGQSAGTIFYNWQAMVEYL